MQGTFVMTSYERPSLSMETANEDWRITLGKNFTIFYKY